LEILRSCDIVNCTIEQCNSFHRSKSEFIKAHELINHLSKLIRRRRQHSLRNMSELLSYRAKLKNELQTKTPSGRISNFMQRCR